MTNEKGIIIAFIMGFILLTTGAAATIIKAFGSAFGWLFGGIMGILIILMIILAGFNKNKY
ncbi:MAG: hypothetical protein AABX54_01470 [Nanoarchaeota archaeon]